MAYFVGVLALILLVQCNLARSSDGASASASAAAAAASGPASGAATKKDARCEEITIPMCKGIGYNWTSMPNALHHGNAINSNASARSRSLAQKFTLRRSKRTSYSGIAS